MIDLTHTEFDDIIFMPCRRDRTSPTGYGFGVHANDGTPQTAFNHPWCRMLDAETAQLHVSGPAIYGGMVMDHFGHFLMEAMSRLWFILAHPDLPIVWHWIDLPVPHAPWAGWIDEAWRLLGLKDRRHHHIRAPVRLGRIVLPQSGLTADNHLHPRQVHALAQVHSAGEGLNGRVWLSRYGLPAQFGRIKREEKVETILASHGWTIVRPQTMSVAAQAEIFAAADVVAGFAGSAFHAVLLSATPKARLLILDRPSVQRNYYLAVAKARALRQAFLSVPLQSSGQGLINPWTSFRLVDPSEAARAILEIADSEQAFVSGYSQS